ncbi:MAG: right-handed parallel beta-helix repeat-containing protein, partial [Anaerolineales bacterium]|nr:right-handed parallel beta-helix repeat-containing protein [Anaerolineales bacterium]
GVTLACNQTTTDQLGADRPLNSGDACTAGAVEVAPVCTSWTVTTADELSECITLANANESPSPTADTITLGADINLSTALPQITSEITLEGANHVIDGGWDGVPGSPTGRRIFTVNLGGDLTIKDTILQNGSAREGGGISNNGRLTVMNSTISSNYAYSPIGNAYAGGIFNNGTLAVTNSTISGNSAINGAGIGNSGTLTVTNSTFSGNSAYFDGGGIFNSGTLTVMNSTFVGNEAQYNWGGGINNYGTLRVTNSTFSGNSATYGGGIYNYRGGLTATNSTFSGNDAINGGGIYNSSTAYLAGNVFAAGLNGDNCTNSGTLTDNGYNLSDDGTCTNGGTGSVINAALNLGTLADNGGPTLTHALLAGSAAF